MSNYDTYDIIKTKNASRNRGENIMKRVLRHRPAKTPCGYCHNRLHKGFVTPQAAKEHGCFTRNCQFFEIFEDHPTRQRERKQNMENRVRKHLLKTHPEWDKSKCYDIAHNMTEKQLTSYIQQHMSEQTVNT